MAMKWVDGSVADSTGIYPPQPNALFAYFWKARGSTRGTGGTQIIIIIIIIIIAFDEGERNANPAKKNIDLISIWLSVWLSL